MFDRTDSAFQQLCQQLQIDSDFFELCLQEEIVQVHNVEGHLELSNGTVLRLRQLERICTTMNVSLSVALLLLELTTRVDELEEQIRLANR